MKVSILIGFEYNQKKYLPGIKLDISNVYSFVKKINSDRILIVSDHKITFNISKNTYVYQYNDVIQLLYMLKTYITDSDQLLIYYTGHSENKALLLPDYNYLLIEQLKQVLIENSRSYAQILVLLDCCQGSNLDLPYLLINDSYKLTNSNDKIFITQHIILCSSTLQNEDSVTSKNGSLFTKILFQILTLYPQYKQITQIVNLVLEHSTKIFKQTVTVHSSYPNDYILWNWVYY